MLGLGYALSTATLFQSLIKIFIGGLRPHFLTLCAPNIAPPKTIQFFTPKQICTTPNKAQLKEVQMSFPSGHACAAFAGFGFLALYLNAHFKILASRRGFRDIYSSPTPLSSLSSYEIPHKRTHHWEFVLFALPLVAAVILAASKIRDMWHHPVDVIFGAVVGSLFALWAYRMVYRSVWDERVNHLPLGEDGRVV